MKKILAAIDGLKFSQTTTAYAVNLAQEMQAQLVGVFLDDYSYHSYKIYDLINEGEGISAQQMQVYDEQDKEARRNAVALFKTACMNAGISYSVHHDRNYAIRELLRECLFADLLVIESRETLAHFEENAPTQFIQQLISGVECPVILVPGEYKPVERISLLCDGKSSSLYAIKMLSYLFPSCEKREIEIIQVQRSKKTGPHPDHRLMKEFMKRHFPQACFTLLTGQPEFEIINYLRTKNPNQLIVLGAYRRSTLSRLIKPSLADALMKQLGCPLFIAHH